MSDIFTKLDALFHPKSIAFVGVSLSNPNKWTNTFWNSIREFKYEGQLYPVNPAGGELDGYKVYRTLEEVPGRVDYVIGTVPASAAPDIMRQSVRKNVSVVHFCTAGFAETGEEDVAGLQQELTRLARETGVRVIGPNCMGIYCPESRVTFDDGFAREAGTVGFISQSGGNTFYLCREAGWRGVRFSKVVSFGNACDLNESDFLEYMIDDPQTQIIGLYLESVKDGRRFLNLIREASKTKPVVLTKGGIGEAGARAAFTHTASLAGNDNVWNTLCRQFNLIRPKNMETMVDVLVTLYFMPDPGGRNFVMIGPGGGASVLFADEFERLGFRLPPLPENLRQKLLSFIRPEGRMLRNPIDVSDSIGDEQDLSRAIDVLTQWDEINFCVGFYRPSQVPIDSSAFKLQAFGDFYKAFQKAHKPMAYICESGVVPERHNVIFNIMQKFVASGIPLYYTFTGAADAISKVVEYNERRRGR